MMGYDRDGIARAATAIVVHRTNILPKLPCIRTPTLVLCGSDDQATPVEKSEHIVAAIPNARLTLLDGLGHMSPLEDPETVNELVVPFVRSCIESPSPREAGAPT
jgi:pimeloyl-ACP methyl ester carboxylesterase